MKKYFALILVLAVIALSVTCFAEEVYKPGRHNTGTIGTSSYYWRQGYFTSLNNARVPVSTHDFESASVAWTLSATEKESRFLYVSAAADGAVIIGPSETGRIYTLYNNSGQAITLKKSGGTGISIANGKVATLIYATNDYVRVTADQTF